MKEMQLVTTQPMPMPDISKYTPELQSVVMNHEIVRDEMELKMVEVYEDMDRRIRTIIKIRPDRFVMTFKDENGERFRYRATAIQYVLLKHNIDMRKNVCLKIGKRRVEFTPFQYKGMKEDSPEKSEEIIDLTPEEQELSRQAMHKQYGEWVQKTCDADTIQSAKDRSKKESISFGQAALKNMIDRRREEKLKKSKENVSLNQCDSSTTTTFDSIGGALTKIKKGISSQSSQT